MQEYNLKFDRNGPSCVARYAADLEVFLPPQGHQDEQSIPIDVELSLNEQEFRSGQNIGFKLRFRRVFLELSLVDCEMLKYGRYERTFSSEEYSLLVESVNNLSKSKLFKYGLLTKAQVDNLADYLGVGISANLDADRVSHSQESKKVKTASYFKIVRFCGSNTWEIGDAEIGDPSKDDNLLRGSYFNKTPDNDLGNGLFPLCFVRFLDKANLLLDIKLVAKKTDCVYLPLGRRPILRERWERSNKKIMETIFTIKCINDQNERDGIFCSEDSIVLATGQIRGRKRKI